MQQGAAPVEQAQDRVDLVGDLREALRQDLCRAPRSLVGVVEVQKRAGDDGRLADLVTHVGRRQPETFEHRIPENLQEVRYQALVLTAREGL